MHSRISHHHRHQTHRYSSCNIIQVAHEVTTSRAYGQTEVARKVVMLGKFLPWCVVRIRRKSQTMSMMMPQPKLLLLMRWDFSIRAKTACSATAHAIWYLVRGSCWKCPDLRIRADSNGLPLEGPGQLAKPRDRSMLATAFCAHSGSTISHIFSLLGVLFFCSRACCINILISE